MPNIVGVYGSEEADPDAMLFVERVFHVEPLSVEYLKITVPVGGATPVTPAIATVAVIDCPIVIGLAGLSVGIVIVGFALLTVRVTGELYVEGRTSVSPLNMALNL